jgi:hypothetical protein
LLALVLTDGAAPAQDPAGRTQVRFTGPAGMKVQWYIRTPDGRDSYSQPPLVVPGRYNFRQGAGYRLKLSQIPGHPGLVLYPTLEVVAPGPAAQAFLAHSAVALELTDDDFRQVVAGSYVVRAVTLPGAGQGSGSALVILRMGNVDREVP